MREKKPPSCSFVLFLFFGDFFYISDPDLMSFILSLSGLRIGVRHHGWGVLFRDFNAGDVYISQICTQGFSI